MYLLKFLISFLETWIDASPQVSYQFPRTLDRLIQVTYNFHAMLDRGIF